MKKSKKKIKVVPTPDEPVQSGARVEEFLPRPEALVLRPKGVKVTLTLSEDSLNYFKHQAVRLQTPYQRMIRNLIDEYVRQMQRKG